MKNQATVEFMIIFTVFILAAAVAGLVSFQKINEITGQQEVLDGEGTVRLAASTLDRTLIEGDGFSTKLNLPDSLSGRPYNITLHSGLVVLNLGGHDFTKTTLVTDFTGSLSNGGNTLKNSKGTVEIS